MALVCVVVFALSRRHDLAQHQSQIWLYEASRFVRRKGAAPRSGAEEKTARAKSTYAQYTCLLSLQMGSTKWTAVFDRERIPRERRNRIFVCSSVAHNSNSNSN
jgi:hypothetical protein